LRKLVAKLRYCLGLIVIVLTILNVTVSTNHFNVSSEMHSLNSGSWDIETL
jgi:hypothetical protein